MPSETAPERAAGARAGERVAGLSGFVICKDEEAYIADCLRSLDICDEIVVVDSGSTDRTLAIVESLKAEGLPIRLVHQDWLGYSRQKQRAMELTTGSWVLSLDSDERLDGKLRACIPALVRDAAVSAYSFSRRPFLIGYGFVPEGVDARPIVRLARRERARFDEHLIVHEGIDVDGPVRRWREGAILHDRPLPLHRQLLKENEYSSLKASYVYGRRGRPRYIRLFFNPLLYFIRIYLFRQLFRCGWPGFIYASTGVIYSFMTELKILQMHVGRRHDR